jgi:tetratricopeptide (TPR) repeat protein
MNYFRFPPEIQVFETRLSPSLLELIKNSLSELSISLEEIKLKDWYKCVTDLYQKEESDSSILLALIAKLAWILADTEFFISKIPVSESLKEAPLALIYIGIGITELIDFKQGFPFIEEGYNLLKSQNDLDALLDIATPYALILNNSDNKERLKFVNNELQTLFMIKTEEDLVTKPQLIPCYLFGQKKEHKISPERHQTLLSAAIDSKDNLNIALTHTLLRKEKGEADEVYDAMTSIKHLDQINARYRLIIAYTNYGRNLGSKVGLQEAKEYFKKAISIANHISIDKGHPNPLTVYPLSQSAEMQIECGELDKAEDTFHQLQKAAAVYNNSMYQANAEFGLAYVAFLLLQNESALNHAKKGLSYAEKLQNDHLTDHYKLKYTNLLVELNKLEEAREILISLSESNLDPCASVLYKYIKGKVELQSHNIGSARLLLQESLTESSECKSLRSSILFALTEGYLYEYRISEDDQILTTAQETLEKGLQDIKDIPKIVKGKWLNAVLLIAQGKIYEAEDLLLEIVSRKKGMVPRIFRLAEELLDDIRQRRVERVDVSPLSNIKDVVRYLRDAKSFIELDSR